MRVFITGTDTDIGKTVISSWLCLHTGFSYYKPIQTGIAPSSSTSDRSIVYQISGTSTLKEYWVHEIPNAPQVIGHLCGEKSLKVEDIPIPEADRVVIEGVGGVLVPLNDQELIIDMILYFNAPVILVTRPYLGTINHTLLSLEALQRRNIVILGVIMNGPCCKAVMHSIQQHGKIPIIAEFPILETISYRTLQEVSLPRLLMKALNLED
ncbi:dethiobiotin synthase [Holospora curviuscula]|uniref:ATP-dependent dethiobiotin synthetase BioD n=1 Tax=Holospora curviuscula TaxID=1082868 RepID=A0A2S5R7B5_9PROT|nr:dethiobiotin synthase [Holospora curviuscula]PPE03231.1 ATP-dependent dethiobiotin synthetase BioD [Holospora curviuscula]